ncbi:hypothetical protein ABPG72_007276 [Tetrahymena utriculariae]
MEEDFKIQEEQSEYISISKLQKYFLESDLNIQSILQEISSIYQQSHDAQIKNSIRSTLKDQLSKHSSNLQQSLSNLTFSLNEDHQEEEEEQKQNPQDDRYQNKQEQNLFNYNLVKSQNGYDEKNNINNSQMSVKSSNKFQPNFYRNLNNIELSREYNYFKDVKIFQGNQSSQLHKDSKIQNENEVDTLQCTNNPSQIMNDEVYQRRQSEKKNNGENNSQNQSNCSSFIREKEEQELIDVNQCELIIKNKSNESKPIENTAITDNNQNISQVRNRSQILQSNLNEFYIQNHNQEDLGQNIEGQENIRKQNKNQQRLNGNRNYFQVQVQNNKKALLLLLLVISITLAILVALKPKIMHNFLFLNCFKESFKQIQFKEQKASLEVQINYTQKLEQQLKEMKDQEKQLNATISKLNDGFKQQQLQQKQKEFEQQNNINNLKQQLEHLKQLMTNQNEQYNLNVNKLQQSLQNNISKQEFLQQQNSLLTKEKSEMQTELSETISKYEQLKELYDNLHQVLELFKKTSL